MSNNAMSNETDLDWLARNVHVWPDDKNFAQVSRDVYFYITKPSGVESFTRQQWLTRRAELQNKPSWEDAPEWAVYMAQSPNGHWEFFAVKPRAEGWWRYPIGERSSANNASIRSAILGEWRDTLDKRPETNEMPSHSNQQNPSTNIPECEKVKQFEPFVSVEDAKIAIMQSDGDVKHFGGIIGRSLLLEEDAATAKQPAPKGSGNPILGMVLADLTNRALEGKEKYGEPLLAHNGRNPLWDAYQEALDLAMYLRQAIEELG